jgi:hypothetical protein
LLLLRRNKKDNLRTTLYHVIERFEEIIEEDLSKPEQEHMLKSIQAAMTDDQDPKLIAIANDLSSYLQRQEDNLVPHQPDFLENLAVKYLDYEDRIFSNPGFYPWLVRFLGIMGSDHPHSSIICASFCTNQDPFLGDLGISVGQ